jgi:protein-disulfide isomerase
MKGITLKNRLHILLVALAILCSGTMAGAEVEFSRMTLFDLDNAPIDMAVSGDGETVYLLTRDGDIGIYDTDGKLEGSIHVGAHITSIAAGPSENQLLIGSTEEKTVETISLEQVYDIDIAGSPFQGAVDAPVEIAVFMDYQCPYCVRLKSVLEEVLDLNEGLVKIVYKQFPLKMHAAARDAAAAALVALGEGKFLELHNLMEDDYKSLDKENILDKVESLGFDRTAFASQMADPGILKQIQKDIADGKAAGVKGIPTVFINGRKLKKRNLEGFQTLIDQALEGSGK